jgi:hypothetical protein
MATSFATQTTSSDGITAVSRAMRHDTPRSSRQWLDYYRRNLAVLRPIPWERGAEITDAERDAICPSLQAWQLGETSEGVHLRAAAFRHGLRHHDPDFLPAVEQFILEEQRHGELLGRFLDLAGVPRKQKDWGDSLFRGARYCLRNMESWTTPVIMVEVLALVYYNGLRRATNSAVLSAICRQVLADEIPHIRYQCERLASIFRARPTPLLRLTMLAHRIFFLLVVLLVWAGHRRALRAGGYSWRHYWRAAWDRMGLAWRLMEPGRYVW